MHMHRSDFIAFGCATSRFEAGVRYLCDILSRCPTPEVQAGSFYVKHMMVAILHAEIRLDIGEVPRYCIVDQRSNALHWVCKAKKPHKLGIRESPKT